MMKRHSQNVSAMLTSPSSEKDFFPEIQNPEPSSLGAEQEGRAEEETALNENHMHSVCEGDMTKGDMFYTLWKWPLGNFSLDGL